LLRPKCSSFLIPGGILRLLVISLSLSTFAQKLRGHDDPIHPSFCLNISSFQFILRRCIIVG
jgi:hypothetical protein